MECYALSLNNATNDAVQVDKGHGRAEDVNGQSENKKNI